jgi:hypothetical protein
VKVPDSEQGSHVPLDAGFNRLMLSCIQSEKIAGDCDNSAKLDVGDSFTSDWAGHVVLFGQGCARDLAV